MILGLLVYVVIKMNDLPPANHNEADPGLQVHRHGTCHVASWHEAGGYGVPGHHVEYRLV